MLECPPPGCDRGPPGKLSKDTTGQLASGGQGGDLPRKLRGWEFKPQQERWEKGSVRTVSKAWTSLSCKTVTEFVTLRRKNVSE